MHRMLNEDWFQPMKLFVWKIYIWKLIFERLSLNVHLKLEDSMLIEWYPYIIIIKCISQRFATFSDALLRKWLRPIRLLWILKYFADLQNIVRTFRTFFFDVLSGCSQGLPKLISAYLVQPVRRKKGAYTHQTLTDKTHIYSDNNINNS